MRFKRFKKRKSKANKAIVLTEFVLAFLMILPILLAVFRISGTHAFGSYAQYATFMTARAYLSGGLNDEDRKKRTIDAFESYLGGDVHISFGQARSVPSSESGMPTGLEIVDNEAGQLWANGVRYNFRAKLFPNFMGKILSRIFEMEAESLLGKDIDKETCQSDMQALAGGDDTVSEFHWDNGC